MKTSRCTLLQCVKLNSPIKSRKSTTLIELTILHQHWELILKKIVFEKTSGLHMHGIILIPRNLSLTRFRVRGWSIKLEEIYDVEGWLRYLYKDISQDEDDEDLTQTPSEEHFEIPKIKLFI